MLATEARSAGRLLAVLAILSALSTICFAEAPTFVMVEEVFGNDTLLTVHDGVETFVGSIGYGDVRGIEWDPTLDTLFGVSRTSDRLLALDLVTGAGTEVSGLDYLPPGSNTGSLTLGKNADLAGLGHVGDQSALDTVLLVDKVDGTAAPIGSFGMTINAIAWDPVSARLLGVTFDGDLYEVSEDGNSISFLGDIDGTVGNVTRIAIDQATGVLYGVTGSGAAELCSIDTASFVATPMMTLSNTAQIYAFTVRSTPLMAGTDGLRRVRRTACTNLGTGQRVEGPATADDHLICGAHGLEYSAGDRVELELTGVVDDGEPVGGWIEFMTPQVLQCQNLTTRQQVMVPFDQATWDCEAQGLSVLPGDKVRMRIRGVTD
jgi:hypothetical protein